MPQELTAALASAYRHKEPEERVEAIKLAVSRQLEETDSGIKVRHTEYFNSSIAPDLVLRWPRESRERFVFLRPNRSPDWLANDLEWISSTHPLVITLETALQEEATERYGQIRSMAVETDTLIADAAAVEELREGDPDEPAAELMAQAVLRGGRGVLDEQSTRTAISSTVAGFQGAERVSLPATRRATQLIATLLQADQASRLSRVLQSVWEGHGGKAADFPGLDDLSGRMTDADLEFLLTSVPTQSVGFWRRIGRGLETPQIARLELPEYSANLQVLIVANSDILFTRGMRVLHEQPKLDEGRISASPRWIVSRKCLALRGSNWTAYIAPESVANLPPAEKHVGPAVLDLRARTDRWACKIEKLELDAGDRVISYSSKEGEDVVHDDRLSALADQRTTRVRRATVALPGGRRLGIDFTNLSATGQTSATFTIGEIVKSALPIMVALDEDETDFLERLPRGESSPTDGEQEVLDLDI